MTSINTNNGIVNSQIGINYLPRAPEPTKPAPNIIEPAKSVAPAVKIDPIKMQNDLRQVVAMLNQNMEKLGRNLGFSFDEKAGRPVVTVTDRTTGEVVRQIPDETVLRIAHSIEDMRGLFLNKVG
jgi:flagellar protein FlaG